MVKIANIIVDCSGKAWTTIDLNSLPGNGILVAISQMRTPDNDYHYVIGYSQVANTSTVYVYYDAPNSGSQILRVSYI